MFFYTVRASNLLFNSSFDSDIEGFKNATELLCSMNYEDLALRDQVFKADQEQWLDSLCFQNIYIIELLEKFGIKTFENVHFIDKVKFVHKIVRPIYYYFFYLDKWL